MVSILILKLNVYPKGLRGCLRTISAKKGETEWLLEFRLKASGTGRV
jgi:hypothetical protein